MGSIQICLNRPTFFHCKTNYQFSDCQKFFLTLLLSDSENLDTLINSVEGCLLISDQSQQRSGDTSKPQNHKPLRLFIKLAEKFSGYDASAYKQKVLKHCLGSINLILSAILNQLFLKCIEHLLVNGFQCQEKDTWLQKIKNI